MCLNIHKGKFKIKAYYVKDDAGILDNESDYEDGDCMFLVKKDVPKIDVSKTITTTLHVRRDRNEQVIDSGCSNHMTSDKSKFIKNEKYNGGYVRFRDD